MPINIDEIKKLPQEEKLKIIEQLWESIEEDWAEDDEEESPEVLSLLDERLKKREGGETKFYTGEEVRNILGKKVEEVRKAKNERNSLHH